MIRIVKMTFQPEKVGEFLDNFTQNQQHIRNFEGIEHLELLNDKNNPNTYFTYSVWRSEKYLNNYRNSDLFKTVWEKTKPLFSDKAEAWSVDSLVKLP